MLLFALSRVSNAGVEGRCRSWRRRMSDGAASLLALGLGRTGITGAGGRAWLLSVEMGGVLTLTIAQPLGSIGPADPIQILTLTDRRLLESAHRVDSPHRHHRVRSPMSILHSHPVQFPSPVSSFPSRPFTRTAH